MEIKSNCCCFSKGLIEEVHVLKQDCPIKRDLGQRSYEDRGKQIEDCTCIYTGILSGGAVVPKCKHYGGTKKKRGQDGYFVTCYHE